MEKLVQAKKEKLEQLAQAKGSHSFADCFERWIDYKSAQIEITSAWDIRTEARQS